MIAPKVKLFKSQLYFVVFVIYYYSVDATKADALCRFVSDSPAKSSNCKMKICCFFDRPYLCFFAKTDIELGKELRYDYGDDENMWWRGNVSILAECLRSCYAIMLLD